jgi:hypothetical protein
MLETKKTNAVQDLPFILSQVVLPVLPTEIIGESLQKINKNYNYLYQAATAIEDTHMNEYYPIIEYYEKNKNILFEAIDIIANNEYAWRDFYTTVQQNSSRWLLPMTVFYPTLIPDPITPDKIDQVSNWLKKYYPIRNQIDNTLNFVEKQRFIVSCYTYQYASKIQILDQPYSYCNCSTQSGLIALHCQTKITGGWVNCHQGSYNCSHTINCYPTRNVDCWYETPYLKSDGTPINQTDPVSMKQVTISKIQANLNMEYLDRRENDIKNFVFEVEDCDWVYIGEK